MGELYLHMAVWEAQTGSEAGEQKARGDRATESRLGAQARDSEDKRPGVEQLWVGDWVPLLLSTFLEQSH